jgi:NAD(P)-dependent dehydrogenase (short-subunit alcohol dehydrogenase family)
VVDNKCTLYICFDLSPDSYVFISHYTPTKAGILSLMQSTAVALGQYNIRANAILPGTILTDINKEDLSNVEKRAAMEKRTCVGRLGRKYRSPIDV